VQAGKALKRSYDMPSRPMSFNEAHNLSVKGQLVNDKAQGPKINITVEQNADQTQSKAKLQIIDKENNIHIKLDELGFLQTYKGWASFTGTAKLKESEKSMPVLVTIDEEDPFTGKETIRIKIGDEYQYNGTINGELIVD
jgi:hypothetical protein